MEASNIFFSYLFIYVFIPVFVHVAALDIVPLFHVCPSICTSFINISTYRTYSITIESMICIINNISTNFTFLILHSVTGSRFPAVS